MQFRILGPLEVLGDAGPVHIGGPSVRSLLIALLSHPNDVMCTERLHDWLWPQGPPRAAVSTLHGHVSVLRRLLEPARQPWSPPQVLLTRHPGYLLRVPPDELDSLTFESLLTKGRQALEHEDALAARTLLTEAIELWRGSALTDVVFLEAAQPTIRRLEELRLTATQLRIDAELALGRHMAVVPELVSLTRAHPLHEPFYGRLMVALSRSGRRAEALAVYAEAQDTLSREMALQPSPSLRRLRSAILADETTVRARS